jgi:hypothetical protein
VWFAVLETGGDYGLGSSAFGSVDWSKPGDIGVGHR